MVEANVRGDEIRKIATNELFEKVMIDMLRGYPQYEYFGILEYYFGNKKIVDILKRDGFLDVPKKEEKIIKYRLSPEGIKLAVALLNSNYSKKISEYSEKVLEYNEEVSKYSRRTHKLNISIHTLTIIMVIFTIGVFFIGFVQLLLSYLQNPIPLF